VNRTPALIIVPASVAILSSSRREDASIPLAEPTPVDLKLIPYYAWGNRGPSAMSVWLPLGR
jgi:DUF1680 family protein